MRIARVSWAFTLCCACGLGSVGCGESDAQPVVQTDEMKAQQVAAAKATADAFKDSQKAKPRTAR